MYFFHSKTILIALPKTNLKIHKKTATLYKKITVFIITLYTSELPGALPKHTVSEAVNQCVNGHSLLAERAIGNIIGFIARNLLGMEG